MGQARRGFRHQVGGGRTDDDQIGRARQLDVPHIGFIIEVEQFREDLFAGQGRHRQRRDEFLSALGDDAAAVDPTP